MSSISSGPRRNVGPMTIRRGSTLDTDVVRILARHIKGRSHAYQPPPLLRLEATWICESEQYTCIFIFPPPRRNSRMPSWRRNA
jgi:hypothetical protein